MRDSRKRPLAVGVLVAFGTSLSADLFADNVIVDDCGDSDNPFATTLRQAIAIANNGDVVDLSGLGCSTITLAQGELSVEQNTLELRGPPDQGLTIDAHGYSRAINHVGTGTLYVTDLDVTYGVANSATDYGGCLRSNGTLDLLRSTISHCTAGKFGGGAYAYNLHAAYSRIYTNSAQGGGGLAAVKMLIEHGEVTDNHVNEAGGGVRASYTLTINDSIISTNTAGKGGAAHSDGKMYLTRTTISGNAAIVYGGGLSNETSGTQLLKIIDSTIDNNFAGYAGGGVDGQNVEIIDSTVSANSTGTGVSPFAGFGGGVRCQILSLKNSTVVENVAVRPAAAVVGGIQAQQATIVSSIVANNIGSLHADLEVPQGGLTAYTSLIRSSSEPSVSLTVDPRLGPLADHGGGHRTHAVLPGSPVINVGSNPLSLQYDERGLPRVVGPKPDIGAYERQTDDDQLLFDGFDSS